MKGSWVYDDGSPNEPQEYEFNSYTFGTGFRRVFKTEKGNPFGLGVLAFAGYSFFEFEHTEKSEDVKVEFEDSGYELSVDVLGTYELGIGHDSLVYTGVGYKYASMDDINLDLTEQGITLKIGTRITF